MDIAACVQWMTPFAMTLRDVGPAELKFFSQIATEDTHAIQTHSVDLNLLVCIALEEVKMLLVANLNVV